ncbi:MAG: PhnD/SsuA/transferrin family substrate-binding protein, partial [Gammaproteobacteria bacterium]|nr:PhnD/SsuA/transferrin family substrate-binding protein [Gammaproteobacteria bacterium]MBT4081234.1 PhnD/SsuA/transferrin family substrate-binding protein [Gammaproteobacteria bacterium]MBT4330083.1 PhnD/SsuA/transferrin family substrate-binding protein [Gammaproteobacteria bacterium]MBT5635799.1 PhnD/SsuA/transferrin family substrate-binding protein [Gammaproteobacteria bacterium]MBT5746902.1 PhnD/SsuA/transferrin family substrate-binding protein [Gammaproteobacteria bacterium]
MIFQSILLLLTLSAIPLAALPSVENGHYKVGVLAYKGKADAIDRWKEHGHYLSKQLAPLQFEIVPLSYQGNEMTRAVVERKVDFIITNPGHYTELELEGHVSRLATRRMISEEGVIDQFGGVAITLPRRTEINAYSGFAGKHIVIPSKSSLGGWQVHLREAITQGVDLREVASVTELKNHRKVVQAILRGEADAGFVRSDLIEGMVKKGELQFNQVRVVNPVKQGSYPYLLSTRLYPEWPFAMVGEIPHKIAVKVLHTLIEMPHNEEAAIVAGIAGWTIPGNYSTVVDLFQEAGLGP